MDIEAAKPGTILEVQVGDHQLRQVSVIRSLQPLQQVASLGGSEFGVDQPLEGGVFVALQVRAGCLFARDQALAGNPLWVQLHRQIRLGLQQLTLVIKPQVQLAP